MLRVHPPENASQADDAAAQAGYQSIDIEQWLRIYEQMLKIRYFEGDGQRVIQGRAHARPGSPVLW
jgi:TPP-dependent pyruvate/acetoin dehydrogenase alpha subunit